MQDPEPVSSWHGRARLAAFSFGVAAALCGCTAMRPVSNTRAVDDLEFLGRAMDGGGATREAMWKETGAAVHTQDTALRLALLQSIPDHSGYDPAAAQHNLRALLAQNPPESIAALARVRLNDLRSSNQCVGETQELRRRLSQVVDIERQLDDRKR